MKATSIEWMYWGLTATLAQMLFEYTTQGLHFTRMSLPYMVGTIYTSHRSRAKFIGFLHHIVNGTIFTVFYVIAFHLLGIHRWWLGAIIGLFQALFVLTVGMSLLPEFHPRMASERAGPMSKRQLEPPGFLALNYGPKTPITIILSHIIFGSIIGSFCHP